MSFQQSPKPQQSHQPQSQPFDGHQSPESLGYDDDSARQGSNFQGSSVASNEPSGLSRFLMFGLVVLALLASVLMLFMDSDGWLKVALIAALWAAFFGLVLVLRYSGALKLAREQAENQESYFQSQLEHERAQLEKREAATQAKYAAEAKKSQDQRDKHLAELRAELAHMRKQLSELTGEDFDEGEQRAVRATAERVRELGHSVGEQTPQAAGRPAGQQEAQPHKAQHRSKPKFNTGTFAAVNWTGQDSEETSQLPLVVDTTAMDEAKRAKAAGSKVAQPKPAQKRRAQMPSAEAVRPGRVRAGAAQEAGAQDADAKQAGQSKQAEQAKEQAGSTGTTHGRRRADEMENGLTVAELMQRFKNREK